MFDSAAQPGAFSLNLGEAFSLPELLPALLNISLTGVILFEPVYNANRSEITDLAYVMLNATAQRMLGLPQRPDKTFLQLYPHAQETGIFAFYRDTFLSGESGRYAINYQYDGLNNYFHLAAQRSGKGLVVSFDDTADHARTAVEEALRASQAREQAARAEADLQRQQLHNILMQAPAMICLFKGPQHIFQLVNPLYQQLVGERPLLGKPIAEAMPELTGQPIFGLLNKVYRTGESFHAHEMLVQLDHDNSGGDLGQNYYNFIYQATRNLAGNIDGIMVFAYEVTTLVQARRQVEYSRQQVQDLNEELQATNQSLQETNEQLLHNITELARTQQALQKLNEELEDHVAARTQQLQRAQAETEHQRARLERFFMQAPAAICILDGPDLIHELVNPAYQQLLPGRQLIGKPLLAALPELTNHPTWQTLQHVYQTGEVHEENGILVPLARYEGGRLENVYLNYTQQARYDENGRIDGVLVFAFEVTEQVLARRQAEMLQAEVLAGARRLAQERETFYQIFEQTPAAICIQRGPEHRYEYYNAAYQQFFPERQLQGRAVAEALPEVITGGFLALLDQVYQTGETYFGYEMPLSLKQPDGKLAQEKYFTFTHQAYREKDQIVGISTFAYDVTEQVLARQEADRRQQLLHLLFMEAPAPIVILDGPELVYELVNPAYQQIFPGRVLQGKAVLDALPELAGTPIAAILNQVYQTGETFVAQEMPLMLARQEGGPLEEIFWTFTYQARHNGWEEVDGIMVFAHEVTDQVKARKVVEESGQQAQALAAELARANEELWVANQEKQAANEELALTNQQLTRANVDLDNFIYTASHDLKAPILNIEGLMDALLDQLSPDNLQSAPLQRTISLILDSVQRFKRTIEHLTEITKLQKENNPETTPVNLAAVIADVQLDLAPAIQNAQARVAVDVTSCPTIRFSEKNLRSIIYNLLSNAIKYRAPERLPLVQVRCYLSAGYQVLSIQDNGLGIDLSRKHKLFGMFQRLHTHVEGTGIGLYMVKKIIDNAGGKIKVESKVGEGTIFRLYFRQAPDFSL